ncbi:MAG: hypothetical protein KBS81_09040, partial [Spirochaetales bacterium]|nr:hypothetical protein [Candidatus Physcosoma equi]
IEEAGYQGESYYHYGPESEVEYNIGDRGPAGGWIFYDKGYYSDGWRYLEIASASLGNKCYGAYRATENSARLSTGSSYPIGSGRLNTEMLVLTMGNNAYTSTNSGVETTSNYAAKACLDYSVNGYDDWFLPSRDELSMIYKNLYAQGIGSFSAYAYWASSEAGSGYGCYHRFSDNTQFVSGPREGTSYAVYPVRAF